MNVAVELASFGQRHPTSSPVQLTLIPASALTPVNRQYLTHLAWVALWPAR